MKHIVTLLLAVLMTLGACALADERADMLLAAAINELGYSATKGGYSKYGEWGGSAYGEWCSEFVSWCVNFADEYYGTSMLGSDYPLQTSCEGGSMWYKERGTGFLNANRAPLKKSENILVFYQKSPVYHPQFTYGEPYRKTNPRSGCSTNYGKFERTGSESSDGRRYPGNVLFVPTVTGGIHPTQKPVELCEYFIKTYTDEGEVVADICAGSGTTAVAAMNTHRRFICFENAPSIYTIAAQRIEQARLAVAGGGKGE